MGKQVKIDFPMTKDLKIPATIELIHRKDKSENVILRTTLDNGKPIKLEAKLKPDKVRKIGGTCHVVGGKWVQTQVNGIRVRHICLGEI